MELHRLEGGPVDALSEFADDEWKVVLHGGVVDGHYHLVRTGRRAGTFATTSS